MEHVTLALPGMWADHHVLTVRELLSGADGVAATAASARDTEVRVTYDPSVTDPQEIAARLEDGGYAVGAPGETETPPTNKPAWLAAGSRVTTTDPSDLSMSGDYRKY